MSTPGTGNKPSRSQVRRMAATGSGDHGHGQTPGRTSYEGMVAQAVADGDPAVAYPAWESLEPWQRARHEAGAAAVLAKVAPRELREAMAETRRVRTIACAMLHSFESGPGGWWHARVGARVFRHWGEQIGPSGVPEDAEVGATDRAGGDPG